MYGILSNANNDPSGNSDQVFFVDGQKAGTFQHNPSGDGSFVYNALLYANTTLSDGQHTIQVQNGQSGDLSSLILFDYLVFTRQACAFLIRIVLEVITFSAVAIQMPRVQRMHRRRALVTSTPGPSSSPSSFRCSYCSQG